MEHDAALQLGMSYPPQGHIGPVIDLGALEEQKAVQPGEELIIRLETISEKGLAEGHSLQVRGSQLSTQCLPCCRRA